MPVMRYVALGWVSVRLAQDVVKVDGWVGRLTPIFIGVTVGVMEPPFLRCIPFALPKVPPARSGHRDRHEES